jgi:Arc/MetJ-type ribon-helix-helix transcriptional regulator
MAKPLKEKVTVSVDPALLGWLDGLVLTESFESRSAAVEAAIVGLHRQHSRQQLERALDALGPEALGAEQELVEAGVDDYWDTVKENTW